MLWEKLPSTYLACHELMKLCSHVLEPRSKLPCLFQVTSAPACRYCSSICPTYHMLRAPDTCLGLQKTGLLFCTISTSQHKLGVTGNVECVVLPVVLQAQT